MAEEASPEPAPAPLDQRTVRRQRAALVALIAAAVFVRAVYFAQIVTGPGLRQHEWENSDMSFFDEWARVLAAGDLLIDRDFHPHHGWHAEVADLVFEDDPALAEELAAEAAADPGGPSPQELLWNRWYGGKQFHQEPLYAHAIGATYALFGTDVRWVYVWQALAGVATVLFAALLARRYFGATAGLVAGAIALFYGPLLFHDMVLLRAGPRACVALALALVTGWAVRRTTAGSWFCAGLVYGLAFCLKTVFAPFALGAAGWLAWNERRRPARAGKLLLSLVAGCAVVPLPFAARNVAVGVNPLAFSSVGAIGLVLAYGGGAHMDEQMIWMNNPGIADIMSRTQGDSAAVAREVLAQHDAASLARILAQRVQSLLHWYESPDNANLYYYRLHAPVLKWTPLSFLFLAPLGLLGLVLAVPKLRTAWPLFLLVAVALLSVAAFYTLGRMRLVLAASLVPFAALALVQLVSWARARRWRALGSALVPTIVLALYVGRPLPAGAHTVRVADYVTGTETYFVPNTLRAADRLDWATATSSVEAALALEPEEVARLGPGRAAASAYEAELAEYYGRLRGLYATCLRNAGRPDEASEQDRRAGELAQAAKPAE